MKTPEMIAKEIERKLAEEHCMGFPEIIPWIADAIRQARQEGYAKAVQSLVNLVNDSF